MRVAIVHYWFVNWRGGEKVVEELLRMFPGADVFTHVVRPEYLACQLAGRKVTTSFIAKLPRAERYYQHYLPLMPLALEQFDLRSYDLVISSESGPSKGIIVSPEARHVCYCHSPMRYLWDMYHDYTSGAGVLKRAAMAYLLHRMRIWDVSTSHRVDEFVANSSYVANRIMRYYRRNASVVYPPVADVAGIYPGAVEEGRHYICMGELVRYKRVDLAIEAARMRNFTLIIIGKGEELEQLQRDAPGNVKFVGFVPDEHIDEYLTGCRGLLFPGKEDFGMVPIEVMKRGIPVIAFKAGGALDYIQEGVNGVFFEEQTAESLVSAIDKFEACSLSREAIAYSVEHFSQRSFQHGIRDAVERAFSCTSVPLQPVD